MNYLGYKDATSIIMLVIFGYLGVMSWQCDLDMRGAIYFGLAIYGVVRTTLEYKQLKLSNA